jgi:hypothetical protein
VPLSRTATRDLHRFGAVDMGSLVGSASLQNLRIDNHRHFFACLAEGVELGSNILQVGPRNRANSHAMQRSVLLLRGLSRLALASCHYGNARSRRQHYRSPAARPMEGFPPAVAS